MKTNAVAFLLLWPGIVSAQAQMASPLTLQRTITLPDGTGKFDHFAYSPAGNRLFVAATGNHSIEVIDLSSDKVVQTLPDWASHTASHGLVKRDGFSPQMVCRPI